MEPAAEQTALGDRPSAWVARRQRSIGGSDAAAVLSVSPYKGPYALWAEKTGRDLSGSGGGSNRLRLRFGNYCEPLIRDEYQRLTGVSVEPGADFSYHPDHPFLSANTDGVVTIAGRRTLWEAKTATPVAFAGQWRDGVPLHYLIQCQHYMAVLGLDHAQVCVLVGFDRIRIFEVPRHDAFIRDALIPAELAFWEHVVNDTPPRPDGSREDFAAISRVTGPPRIYRAALELGPDAEALAHKMRRLDISADMLSRERRETKARLLAEIGNAEFGRTENYNVHRKPHGKGFTIKVEPRK